MFFVKGPFRSPGSEKTSKSLSYLRKLEKGGPPGEGKGRGKPLPFRVMGLTVDERRSLY